MATKTKERPVDLIELVADDRIVPVARLGDLDDRKGELNDLYEGCAHDNPNRSSIREALAIVTRREFEARGREAAIAEGRAVTAEDRQALARKAKERIRLLNASESLNFWAVIRDSLGTDCPGCGAGITGQAQRVGSAAIQCRRCDHRTDLTEILINAAREAADRSSADAA